MTSARAALLGQQRGERAGGEHDQHRQGRDVPADRHGRLVGQAAVDRSALLQLSPAAAHDLGGGARFGGQQVARAAHAVRDGGLADASLGLLAGGAQRARRAGSGSGPHRELAAGRVQRERVLGVHVDERLPRDADGARDVDHLDAVVGHREARAPEQRPAHEGEQRARHHVEKARIVHAHQKADGQGRSGRPDQHGKDPVEPGHENLALGGGDVGHGSMLSSRTVSASPERAPERNHES